MEEEKKIKKFLLSDVKYFLLNKLLLLEKEIYNLKWSINYIMSLEETNNNKNSQFYKDCKFIKNNIKNEKENENTTLLGKIKKIKEILLDKDNTLQNKATYELILLFDCIHNRINTTLLKKFEYLHKAYENLILSYNPLYIPNPSISKLAKTPNLMLFFNYHLNNISTQINNFLNTKKEPKIVFSTWNFIHIDHIASLDDNDKYIPIEFSFWLYEMPIFHCIAYHEIYHKYYFDDEELRIDNTKFLNFFSSNIPLIVREKMQFSKTVIFNIYQDILADLHAYIFSEDIYLYTFFLTGFMTNIHKNFYEPMDVNKKINPDNKCCFKKHENLSIYSFDYDKSSLGFFIRLKILLKFRKLLKKNTDDKINIVINKISEIINIIFPEKNENNLYTFENLLSNTIEYNNYLIKRSIINLLYEVYDKFMKEKYEILIKRHKKIHNQNKLLRNKLLRIDDYKEIFINYLNDIENENKSIDNSINEEYKKIAEINYNAQKNFRIKNLSHIFSSLNINENDIKIYYLTFIKLSRTQKDALIFYNELIDKNNLKNYYNYAFGPYDIIRIKEKEYNFLKDIETELNDKSFFIDNHSLILIDIKNKEDVYKKDKVFNVIISIDIKNIFTKDNKTQLDNFLKQLKDTLNNYNYKIFMSMGNEHLVVYVKYLTEDELVNLLNDIHSIEKKSKENEENKENIINDISSTILLNQKINDNNNKIHSIVILLKLKKDKPLGNYYDEIKKKIDEFKKVKKIKNLFLYKKYGVYDAKLFISEITLSNLYQLVEELSEICLDIQIEKETILK